MTNPKSKTKTAKTNLSTTTILSTTTLSTTSMTTTSTMTKKTTMTTMTTTTTSSTTKIPTIPTTPTTPTTKTTKTTMMTMTKVQKRYPLTSRRIPLKRRNPISMPPPPSSTHRSTRRPAHTNRAHITARDLLQHHRNNSTRTRALFTRKPRPTSKPRKIRNLN